MQNSMEQVPHDGPRNVPPEARNDWGAKDREELMFRLHHELEAMNDEIHALEKSGKGGEELNLLYKKRKSHEQLIAGLDASSQIFH